jgi:hypothetical protein
MVFHRCALAPVQFAVIEEYQILFPLRASHGSRFVMLGHTDLLGELR